MKLLTRILVTRDSDGNDITHQYPLPQWDALSEAISDHGETFVLQAFNAWMAESAKQQERAEFKARQRNKNAWAR